MKPSWKVVAYLLAMLLGVSIALSIISFTLADRFYRDLNNLRLDPLSLNQYGDQPTDPTRQTVVFFGDSRAHQWPVPDGLVQFEFINRGIGSQTSTQVALRFDAHVRPLSPDIIVLQLCVNDLKTIDAFADRRDSIVATCLANVEQIIAQAHEIGATVILTTVFPVGEAPPARQLVWSGDVAASVHEVNESMLGLMGDDVILLDVDPLLADSNGLLRDDLSIDELHLNDSGYALLNEALVEMLLTEAGE